MAKIDATKIAGYDEMSAEEKIKALLDYEYNDNSTELKRYKDSITKLSSEIAENKKRFNEIASEDEKRKMAEQEERDRMRAELEQLKNEKTVATYTAHYTSLGYDESSAKSSAEALAKGDMDTVFAIQKSFTDKREKDIVARQVKDFPKPVNGTVGEKITKEDFSKMSYNEMLEFKREHPDEFKEYSK